MATKKVEAANRDDVIFEGKSVGQLMAESLTEFADDLKAGVDIAKKYSCRNVKLRPKIQTISPSRIIAARQLLGLSQALFAEFLGFSANAVRSWEQGTYQPQRSARIMVEYIHEDPNYWRAKFNARIIGKNNAKDSAVGKRTKAISHTKNARRSAAR